MPPLRTIPAAKPIKTERTHEENQERAYIAASRRSDRSLEARVESARRASEIHKRRTGRSLRVTEQDVINEEMYEEEDDDLPMQYRRLTAHLQTSNADFDRRLAAYLTNHVAMRAALGQAVSDSYNPQQQYSNAPQFANQMGQFSQMSFPNPMLPPQMVPQSPHSFRQSPYPPQQDFRHSMHGRAASIATPQELQNMNGYPSARSPSAMFKSEDRRMSLPTQTPQPATSQSPPRHSPTASRNSSSTNLANLKLEAAKQGLAGKASPQGSTSPPAYQNTFQNMSSGFDPTMMNMMSPFSTALPQESQQLLGPGLDANDPFSQMLMGGHESQPFYSYNPNGSSKSKGMSPSFDGINQTLAPGMLDTNTADRGGNYNTPLSASDSVLTPQGGFGGFNFDSSFDPTKGMSTSGLTTPGEHDWANLIDSNAWEDTSSQPTAVN